jgi:tetratricopeptide (TPR) repeat protein
MLKTIQAMDKDPIQDLLVRAYDSLKASNGADAMAFLEEALSIDFEHPEVVYALKCVNWWNEHLKNLNNIQNSYDRGGFILAQWKAFYSFQDRIAPDYEPCLYAVRRFVFSTALTAFQDILGDGSNEHDPDLLLQVGKCYKGVGNYDQALKYLEQSVKFKRDDGAALSELADVNALIGETRAAKALFREAFFMDAEGVDLRSLESELILLLIERVKKAKEKENLTVSELKEWIPVYGVFFGVFSVKRELKQVELGRLKQAIFSLENEMRSSSDTKSVIIPRLINHYFWLIDYYENTREDPSKIEETMLKIKMVDPGIYEKYRN